MTDFAALAAPFPPDRVSWRVGSSNKKKVQRETGNNSAKATKGMALAFINSRDVQERLDDVCGPGNWQDRYEFHGPRTICYLSIRIDGEWVTKADGAGDSDVEAAKGSISDALKRAAVKWGIGRYLYALPSPWVDLDDWEQITDASARKLEGLLRTDAAANAPRKDTESSEPKTPTLNDRADTFVGALNKVQSLTELEAAWAKGSSVCAALSTADPDKLTAITRRYEARRAEFEDAAGDTPFDQQKAA